MKKEIEEKDDENTILGPRGIMIKQWVMGENDSKPVGTRIPKSEEKEWNQFKQTANTLGLKVSDLFLIMIKQNNRDYNIIIPIANKMGYDPVTFYNQTREQLHEAIEHIDKNLKKESSNVQNKVLNDISSSVKIKIE